MNFTFGKLANFKENLLFCPLARKSRLFLNYDGGKKVRNANEQRAERPKFVFGKKVVLEKNSPCFLHLFTFSMLKNVLFGGHRLLFQGIVMAVFHPKKRKEKISAR